MIWRHLCLARAFAASGILTLMAAGSSMADEPSEPLPGANSAIETVKVLDAEKAGTLGVEVRGAGQESVRVLLKNQSSRKLRVILPPGLVASNAVGQPGGGGGGGGAGGGPFQNMGLGSVGNQAGGFGQFAGPKSEAGFRSVPITDTMTPNNTVTVPVGQTVDVSIPAVCLNYGAPTPTARARFRLVDVDDYSADVRVRKSLRTLATLGTSHGMAQAAMWRICNNTSYDEILSRGEKVVNSAEAALAARFVNAVESGVDLTGFDSARVFVTVSGDASLAKETVRLARDIQGLRILGLPVEVLAKGDIPQGPAPILHLGVTLNVSETHETRGKVVTQVGEGIEVLKWTTIGNARIDDLPAIDSLDAAALVRAVDHAVALSFVTTKVAKRSANGTTLDIRNRLPFTLAGVTLKAGTSLNAPLVDVIGLGVGPGRNGQATIPASMATVERVELNGL